MERKVEVKEEEVKITRYFYVKDSIQVVVKLPEKEPYTTTLSSEQPFIEFFYSHIGDLGHTLCCIPYIIVNGKKITIFVWKKDEIYFANTHKVQLTDKPTRDFLINNVVIYPDITEIGAYWT